MKYCIGQGASESLKARLKILSGELKGMKLFSPPEGLVRPLTSIAKKSGCVFIEKNRKVYASLKKNVDKIIAALDNDAVFLRLRMSGTMELLNRAAVPEAPFDVVFIDPPFVDESAITDCLRLLNVNPGWVSGNSIVFCHLRKGKAIESKGWEEIDRRVFGEDLHLKYRMKVSS